MVKVWIVSMTQPNYTLLVRPFFRLFEWIDLMNLPLFPLRRERANIRTYCVPGIYHYVQYILYILVSTFWCKLTTNIMQTTEFTLSTHYAQTASNLPSRLDLLS